MKNLENISSLLFLLLIVSTSASSYIPADKDAPCDFFSTIDISAGQRLRNGSILHNNIEYTKDLYAEYNYEITNLTVKLSKPTHIRGCLCLLMDCVRFCCPPGQITKNEVCVDHDRNDVFVNATDENQELKLVNIREQKYGLIYGKPCEKMFQLDPADEPTDEWVFLKNGSIYLPAILEIHQTSSYCFTNVIENDEPISEVLLCFVAAGDTPSELRYALYPVGMLLSVPFLVITFFVYGFVPELQNLHGKSLMCYVFGLMVLFISLSVVQIAKDGLSNEACKVVGYLIYSSVLLCFFWLNVMCYDIWSAFRGVNSSRGVGERKRFIFYSLYAFGVPLLFTMIVAFMDNMDFVPDNLRPKMGTDRCLIKKGRLVEFIYIYFAISTILCINITLYSITAYRIFKVQKEMAAMRDTDTQRHNIEADKDRFYLYLRLFIIMGVTWVMESVSWAFKDSYFFYITDVLNCLQGLIIFILFVCKRKILTLVCKRYRKIRNLPSDSTNLHLSMRTETSNTSSYHEDRLSKTPADRLIIKPNASKNYS